MSHSGDRFISIHHLNYYLYCIITMLSSLFIIIYFSTSTVGELRGQIFTTVRLNFIQHLHYHCHCMYYKDIIFIYIKYQISKSQVLMKPWQTSQAGARCSQLCDKILQIFQTTRHKTWTKMKKKESFAKKDKIHSREFLLHLSSEYCDVKVFKIDIHNASLL